MFEKVSADFNFSYTITFILLHLSLKEICMHDAHCTPLYQLSRNYHISLS